MSLRPIEVQGAYPLSQKTGKVQEQLQQRGQVSQEMIGQQHIEEEQRKRKQVNQADASDQMTFNKEGQNKQEQPNRNSHSNEDDERKHHDAKHPFKGKFIDFSG